jgi:hypothetical protein
MDTIEIDSIDVNDRTYCISYPLEDNILLASIARFGILAPVGLLSAESHVIVTGFKRIEAARRLGIRKLPCIYFDIDEKQALLTSINDNLGRPLNTIEKINCVEKMLTLRFPVQDIHEVVKMVGLPARDKTLETARACASLGETTKGFVVRHNLPLATLEQLLWFDVGEIDEIVRLTDSLNITVSSIREALQLIMLLKVKHGRTDFRQLEGAGDMAALRQRLKRQTHPVLSDLEAKLAKIGKACALPPNVAIEVDPVFEKESIDIRIRASNSGELDEAIAKLKDIKDHGLLRSIFELTHGLPGRN